MTRVPILHRLAALLALVLVTAVRFNRVATDGSFSDSIQYRLFIEYFRGTATAAELAPPYSFRPLLPFAASLLPMEALTALNVLNVLALAVSVLVLFSLLGRMAVPPMRALGAVAVSVVSFPVFYYGAVGIVDPALIALLTGGVWLLHARRFLGLALLIFVGTFVKESIVILIPPAVVLLYFAEPRRGRAVLTAAALVGAYFLGSTLTRVLSPSDATFFWTSSWETFLSNVSRPRFWAATALSFGIPGLLALSPSRARAAWTGEDRPFALTMVVGVLMAGGVFAYSIVSAYPDGRFSWLAYPFLIPYIAPSARALRQNG